MANYTGGCLCGAIRFEVNGEPIREAMCHCDDCRRVTGSAFATNIFFKTEDIVITKGTPKEFQHKADSGNTMTKGFCENCGSQIFTESSGSGGAAKGIKIGAFDDVKNLRPKVELFISRHLPFIKLSDETEHYEQGLTPPTQQK